MVDVSIYLENRVKENVHNPLRRLCDKGYQAADYAKEEYCGVKRKDTGGRTYAGI